MSDYPNLEQLGVTSIDDVIKYTLTREARFDVLKVYYKRQPGSFLAQSKKFHFTRGQNHIEASPINKTQPNQHVAPQLLLVTEELRKLMTHKPAQKRAEVKANITERLDSLESVIESKIHRLSQQLNDLD
ncbi:MAG: DUF3461 family protein [Oceanospirillaceae bacterium]